MNNRQALILLRHNNTDLRAMYGILKNNESAFAECLKKYFPSTPAEQIGVALLGRVALAARAYSDNQDADQWIALMFDWSAKQLAREITQKVKQLRRSQ
jgi:hypothetical protein